MNIRSKNIALLFSCVLLSISCVDKYLPDVQELADFIENKWHTHPELTIHERGPGEW